MYELFKCLPAHSSFFRKMKNSISLQNWVPFCTLQTVDGSPLPEQVEATFLICHTLSVSDIWQQSFLCLFSLIYLSTNIWLSWKWAPFKLLKITCALQIQRGSWTRRWAGLWWSEGELLCSGVASACPTGQAACVAAHLLTPLLAITH